ncbi:MAG: hypothetical protein J6Q59_04135 [Paludibacteraceae bacterium]|nr:hypothetical protein [Paludibacteraceae bacterium]
MKLTEYIRRRGTEGLSLTAAINELAEMFGIDPRTPWRWNEAGKAPWYIERLLQIWHEATPEQRARWFK